MPPCTAPRARTPSGGMLALAVQSFFQTAQSLLGQAKVAQDFFPRYGLFQFSKALGLGFFQIVEHHRDKEIDYNNCLSRCSKV